MIGYIDFHDTGDDYDSGYCFHSNYPGNGYAKERHQALIGLFSDMGVKKLTVGTTMKNTPSIKLLHSLDFEQIGTEQVSFYKDNAGKNIYFEGGFFELNLPYPF